MLGYFYFFALKGGDKELRAYFGSPISPNITETPEHFYICKNVPIARTGWYEYLGEEIGIEDKIGQKVRVYRSPDEVFSPAAMASFNGKPVTNEHPINWVMPENAQLYTKGSSQNVRQSNTESDLLLADLMVYDADLIRAIQEGKREVSCGYDCVYEDNGDGTYSQRNICGNHIAVVEAGRAGDRVAIKDSKNNQMEGEKKMADNKKLQLPVKKHSRVTDLLAAFGLKHFATDAEPEEILDAVNTMAEEKQAEKEEESKSQDTEPEEKKEESNESTDSKDAKDNEGVEGKIDKLIDSINGYMNPEQDAEPISGIEAKLDRLATVIEALVKSDKKVHAQLKPEDSLDEVILELETPEEHSLEDEDVPSEEGVTISPENIDEAPISDPKDRPVNPLGSQDNAYKIAMLKELKPIIAGMKDPTDKKKACDALINIVRQKPTTSKKTTYASIINGQRKNVQSKLKSNDAEKKEKFENLGMEYAKKFNPHYKEVK